MSDKKYDLTRGGILDKLLLVALPLIGTQLMMMGYNLVDIFLLGRVGVGAVAASGAAGMYLWLIAGFFLIGRLGAEIGVSQNLGRGDQKTANEFASVSMFMAFVIGLVIMSLCFVFAAPLIGFFHIREAAVEASARNYLRIISCAVPFTLPGAAAVGIFNGAGNSRAPFVINSACLVLNAVLDVIFIFPLGLGVEGAAAATAISQIIACLAALAALVMKFDRAFDNFVFRIKPRARVMVQILRWSLPLTVEELLFTFFTMFISRFAASYGAGAIAVYRIGTQIESLCWLTGVGVSTSVSAFVGQNYGAGKWDRIKECCRVAYIAFAVFSLCVSVFLITAGRFVFGLFLPDETLMDMGGAFLKIIAVCEIFGSLEFVSSGAFRGLGRTIPPSVACVTVNALRAPIAYALSSVIGLNGVWWAITLTASIRGLWIFLWFVHDFRKMRK